MVNARLTAVRDTAAPAPAPAPARSSCRNVPETRESIIRAACAVFGREGYAGSSIAVIAVAAKVAKRTVYNHFPDKAQLFRGVLLDSAAALAAKRTAAVDHHLGSADDAGAALLALALDWAGPAPARDGHASLVRQLYGEAGRLPVGTLEEWCAIWTHGVHEALARCLRQLDERGLLDIADAELAAQQFSLFVSTDVDRRSFHGAVQLDALRTAAFVTSGVRTFLRLYGPAA